MTSWWRSWHGAPTDPKWLAIAQRTQTNAGTVTAVVWALFDHASQAEPRGDVSNFDHESYAAYSGFDPEIVVAILDALRAKGIIKNNTLSAWEKRQPKREDGSAERAKEWRERNRTRVNASERHREDTDTEKNREEKKDSRAVADATRTRPNSYFEDFWKAYPRRQGSNPKHPARKKFEAAVKSGVPPAAIIAAARAYFSEERKLEHVGTPYVAQAVTWLSQQRFNDYRRETHGPPPGLAPAERAAWVREQIKSEENGALHEGSADGGGGVLETGQGVRQAQH